MRVWNAAGLALAVMLAGCASAPPASRPMPDGPAVEAPPGWVAYCAAEPEDPSCKS